MSRSTISVFLFFSQESLLFCNFYENVEGCWFRPGRKKEKKKRKKKSNMLEIVLPRNNVQWLDERANYYRELTRQNAGRVLTVRNK